MSQTRILINGALGRMGQAVAACCEADADVIIAGKIDAGDDLASALADADVVIDFSAHSVTHEVAELCAGHKRPLVIGTTGQTDEQIAIIHASAEKIPVVFAPNFSVGVNTLFWLTRKAAEILGSDYDLEVVEMHHRHKKDSPSGTAKRLGEILAEVAGLDYANDTRHGREGIVGARTHREIGMHAVRGGDVVGDHTVIFAGEGERVELRHLASSRNTFAMGSIRAAKWVAGKERGIFDMQDVLGLGG